MSNNQNNRRGVLGKGYYIALILCAAAIGLSGYLYYRNTGTPEDTAQEQDVNIIASGEDITQDVQALATQPTQKGSATAPSTQATAPSTAPKKLKTASPVSGETVMGYSMDALSYNQTTRDWRVHNGVDIAAAEGTEVMAAADGEVYTVYEDDIMGTTVVIRHTGGYTTKYSSLSEEPAVAPGDSVTLGQVIGTVGTTALVESAMGAHVHFSVTHQDVLMDPAEFLSLG